MPLSSVAPPALSNATFATAGVTVANTTGGTLLAITGVNLGPSVNFTQVTVRVPFGDISATNCTLLLPDSWLQCALPVGSGAISLVTVTVLGQSGTFVPTGLAYAPPSISTLSPSSVPTTGATVTVAGANFGNLLSNVVLLVNGVSTPVSMPVSECHDVFYMCPRVRGTLTLSKALLNLRELCALCAVCTCFADPAHSAAVPSGRPLRRYVSECGGGSQRSNLQRCRGCGVPPCPDSPSSVRHGVPGGCRLGGGSSLLLRCSLPLSIVAATLFVNAPCFFYVVARPPAPTSL